jgi:hypothetical protein
VSVVWVVPALVASLGALAVSLLARGAAEEARELGREVARFGELHVALTRVRAELRRPS